MNNEVNISILDVQTNALSQLSLKWSSRFNRGIVHPGTMSQDLPLDCLHLQIVRIVDQAGKHRLSATETAKRISETHDSHDSQCFQMFPSHHSQRCGLLCQVHLRALNAGETTLPRLLTKSPRVAPSRCLVHIFGENWSLNVRTNSNALNRKWTPHCAGCSGFQRSAQVLQMSTKCRCI